MPNYAKVPSMPFPGDLGGSSSAAASSYLAAAATMAMMAAVKGQQIPMEEQTKPDLNGLLMELLRGGCGVEKLTSDQITQLLIANKKPLIQGFFATAETGNATQSSDSAGEEESFDSPSSRSPSSFNVAFLAGAQARKRPSDEQEETARHEEKRAREDCLL
ncbi:hypothetical protein Ciccas_013244 [Cichlidogyrus casuarinus]|uniref:Uncharacterized protein n=1 Tax=Cichlidogyrus casuarinus TaxID=1844966 RepID=A0ABD2PL32_9PLAT